MCTIPTAEQGAYLLLLVLYKDSQAIMCIQAFPKKQRKALDYFNN